MRTKTRAKVCAQITITARLSRYTILARTHSREFPRRTTTTGDREMSKVKDVFYAWASNDSGASMDIPHSRGNSKTHAIAESRRQMGSGWTIHIMRVFVDGDGHSTMGPGPEEVKKFRIR
jgi:hypothetical protein